MAATTAINAAIPYFFAGLSKAEKEKLGFPLNEVVLVCTFMKENCTR
jgi:hypothetical protein